MKDQHFIKKENLDRKVNLKKEIGIVDKPDQSLMDTLGLRRIN